MTNFYTSSSFLPKNHQFILVIMPFHAIVKLLALALTNLVLDLANLVTKLAKPSIG